MARIDLKQTLKPYYQASAAAVAIVDVPPLLFLMIDGDGNPNTAAAYREAVEALYSVSYTLKFMLKRAPQPLDYSVMPLQGLWRADDMTAFTRLDKDAWRWTMMILQPEAVTAALLHEAIQTAARKKALPALPLLRLERFHEGRAAQIMHLGPYADEPPTIARLHDWIQEQGCALRGQHHEIYLSDPRRSAPEKMKTILRQPISEASR
jgi:hypothetical protein